MNGSCAGEQFPHHLYQGSVALAESNPLSQGLRHFPLQIASDMEKIGEVQRTECPGSYQRSRLSALKEAVVSNECNFIPMEKLGDGCRLGMYMERREKRLVEEEEEALSPVHMWQSWLCPSVCIILKYLSPRTGLRYPYAPV